MSSAIPVVLIKGDDVVLVGDAVHDAIDRRARRRRPHPRHGGARRRGPRRRCDHRRGDDATVSDVAAGDRGARRRPMDHARRSTRSSPTSTIRSTRRRWCSSPAGARRAHGSSTRSRRSDGVIDAAAPRRARPARRGSPIGSRPRRCASTPPPAPASSTIWARTSAASRRSSTPWSAPTGRARRSAWPSSSRCSASAGGVAPWDLTDAIDRGDTAGRPRRPRPPARGRRPLPARSCWPRCTATTRPCCASTGRASPPRRRPRPCSAWPRSRPARR